MLLRSTPLITGSPGSSRVTGFRLTSPSAVFTLNRGAPTLTVSPSSHNSSSTFPPAGLLKSKAALSASSSATSWPSLISSPAPMCQVITVTDSSDGLAPIASTVRMPLAESSGSFHRTLPPSRSTAVSRTRL